MPHNWKAFEQANKIVEMLQVIIKETGKPITLSSEMKKSQLRGKIQIILEES